jgi:hypothetical protein
MSIKKVQGYIELGQGRQKIGRLYTTTQAELQNRIPNSVIEKKPSIGTDSTKS